MESARIAPFGRDFEREIEEAMHATGMGSAAVEQGLVERQRRACARLAETADAVDGLACRLLGTPPQPSTSVALLEKSGGVFPTLSDGASAVEGYCRRIGEEIARIHAAIEGR